MMLFGGVIYAQTATGTVSDANGPLPGANIVIKGTQTGASTDFDGNFTINNVPSDAVLVVSSLGYVTQEIQVAGQTEFDVILIQDASQLDEVVIIGYGSTTKKEITSAVTTVSEAEFNQGTVNSAAGLLQGKVAGLSVYNKGGDPNTGSTVRIRGISTIGANTSPLVVIDGVAGASIDNVDPSDIESINVLKDGSAAAIYGTRGSSGVILVTTKSGKSGGMVVNFNGSYAVSSVANSIDIMTADEFIANGSTDLGSKTDWVDEVTESAVTQVYNVSISGGHDDTRYRVSTNWRDVGGIVKNTGFDQFNSRVNLSTRILNEKLKVEFNSAYTKRDIDYGSPSVMKYATLYNPTAPIYGDDSPFPFNSEQFGGYFETLGLFDSYNPVSIMNQYQNYGTRTEFNYNIALTYDIIDNLSVKMVYGAQSIKLNNKTYAPTTLNEPAGGASAVSPTRKGWASLFTEEKDAKTFELFGTYNNTWDRLDLTLTAGYSYNESNQYSYTVGVGDFPDDSIDWINALEHGYDLQGAGFVDASSSAIKDDRIIAYFGRLNLTWDNAIFFSASLRQEGASRFGEDEKWGLFPSIGAGVDINKYLDLNNVDLFKFRVGYGVTGALAPEVGLSQLKYGFNYNSIGGGDTGLPSVAPNPDLGWETKAELNFGLEFNMGRLSSTFDYYTRDISDFILLNDVDASNPIYGGASQQWQNAGDLTTSGFEMSVNYDIVQNDKVNYNSGIVFSSFKSKLNNYIYERGETRGNLGSPGQNSTNMILVRAGEEIGQIWGPVFSGEVIDGKPQFEDVNGDGQIITGQDKALDDDVDFAVLGKGIPDFELGWTNNLTYKNWTLNAFFRGAFGHSLVNTWRAFYEPRISSQSSYNVVNTELANEEITAAEFSSLYVEDASFFKLDNLSIGYDFNIKENKYIKGIRLTGSGQNLFTITSYTGSDPEPALLDNNRADGIIVSDVLAPGIDRRTNYYSSRTFTLGLNINF